MFNPNDGFSRFRNMIGRQGAAQSNNDYGLGSGSPGVNPAPEPNAAWPNKWKGGDMYGAPPPAQGGNMWDALGPTSNVDKQPTPPPSGGGGFGLGPYNPNGKPGGSWGGVPPSNVYPPKGPSTMPGPPGGFGQMPNGWQGGTGMNSPMGRPSGMPFSNPNGDRFNQSQGPVDNGPQAFGGFSAGGFGQSGPYNPFGKPGSISGAIPMDRIEGGPFGPPRPDPTPTDTFGGPKTPWKGDPFQDRPNPNDPFTPEGGPGSPVRPDPTPTDTFGPPPVSQDYGNIGGMGFGLSNPYDQDTTMPLGQDLAMPRIQRQPGGWKWGQMMNPMNQNSGW